MEEEISNEESITERIKWIRMKLSKSNPFRPDWKDLDWALHQLEREHERANRFQRLRRSYMNALEPMLGDETLTECMKRLVQIALGNPEIAPMAALLKQARYELEEAKKASAQHRKDRILAEGNALRFLSVLQTLDPVALRADERIDLRIKEALADCVEAFSNLEASATPDPEPA